jgi:hypothetical protein
MTAKRRTTTKRKKPLNPLATVRPYAPAKVRDGVGQPTDLIYSAIFKLLTGRDERQPPTLKRLQRLVKSKRPVRRLRAPAVEDWGLTDAELDELDALTKKHTSTLPTVLADIARDRGIQPMPDEDGSVLATLIRAFPKGGFYRVLLDRLRELDRDDEKGGQ